MMHSHSWCAVFFNLPTYVPTLNATQQLKMVGNDEGNPLFPAAEVKTEPVEEREEEPGPSGAGQEEERGATPPPPQAE